MDLLIKQQQCSNIRHGYRRNRQPAPSASAPRCIGCGRRALRGDLHAEAKQAGWRDRPPEHRGRSRIMALCSCPRIKRCAPCAAHPLLVRFASFPLRDPAHQTPAVRSAPFAGTFWRLLDIACRNRARRCTKGRPSFACAVQAVLVIPWLPLSQPRRPFVP